MNPITLFLSLGLMPQILLLAVSTLQLQAYLSRRRHKLVFFSTLAPLFGLLITSAETASALSQGGPALQAVSGSLAGTFGGIFLLLLGKIGERRLLKAKPIQQVLLLAEKRCSCRDKSILNHAIASAISIEQQLDEDLDSIRKAELLIILQSIHATIEDMCEVCDLPKIAWLKSEPVVRTVDAVVVCN